MKTCGAFSAMPLGGGEWELTCSRLPGWREVVSASEADAMAILYALQDEYRGSWESSESA